MKHFAQSKALPPVAAALLLFAIAGCGRDDVKVYHVATNDAAVAVPAGAAPEAMAMPGNLPGDMAVPDSGNPVKLKYALPEGWKEKALTQMRVASLEVSGDGKTADVSVIPLGGAAGTDPANVNRWRGQVGLPSLPDAQLQTLAEKVQITGQPADLYDLAGTAPGSGDPERILGAILHGDDTVWFYKMTGDAALVEKQKPAFIAFLKSVEFEKLAAPSTMDLSQLPPSHPALPGMAAGSPAEPAAAAADKPAWTVPADWKEGQLAQFLVARFVIQGSGEATAAVNVSQLSGDGGGLLPNVNRWRAQLGLPPGSDADLARLPLLDVSGAKATLVDIAGTDPRSGQPAQLVGLVLPLGGQTWFYKLMGDPAVVAPQKAALIKFVQSAKYPADAH